MMIFLKEVLKKVIREKYRIVIKNIYFNICNFFIIYNRYSIGKYPYGINLVGYAKAEMGLGEGCRLIADAIQESGIDFVIVDYEKEHNARIADFKLSKKIGEPKYSINLIQLNADKIMRFRAYSGKKFWEYRYNIAHFAWELPEFPVDWKKSCDYFDEIWTPSNFCTDSIKKITNKPVYTMPFAIHPFIDIHRDREYFGLPENKFLFLTMFDINSVIERKNPISTIKAFKQTFLGNNSVGLVIKVNDFKKKRGIESIISEVENVDNIYILDMVLSKNDVNSLINLCDVFVSLHRSEGFGLVMAEAMYFEKPVIATNWSSNVDFMDDKSACLVGYDLIKIDKDYGVYKKGNTWAQPKEEEAAEYMKKLYFDKDFYKKFQKKLNIK